MTTIPKILSELDGSLAKLQETVAPWLAGMKRYEVRTLDRNGNWSAAFTMYGDNIGELREDFILAGGGNPGFQAFMAHELPTKEEGKA